MPGCQQIDDCVEQPLTKGRTPLCECRDVAAERFSEFRSARVGGIRDPTNCICLLRDREHILDRVADERPAEFGSLLVGECRDQARLARAGVG